MSRSGRCEALNSVKKLCFEGQLLHARLSSCTIAESLAFHLLDLIPSFWVRALGLACQLAWRGLSRCLWGPIWLIHVFYSHFQLQVHVLLSFGFQSFPFQSCGAALSRLHFVMLAGNFSASSHRYQTLSCQIHFVNRAGTFGACFFHILCERLTKSDFYSVQRSSRVDSKEVVARATPVPGSVSLFQLSAFLFVFLSIRPTAVFVRCAKSGSSLLYWVTGCNSLTISFRPRGFHSFRIL